MFKLLLIMYFSMTAMAKFEFKERPLMKPMSVCCDIPTLGDPKHDVTECSKLRPLGPCDDLQCAFDQSGFLDAEQALNKEAYRRHLRSWAESHPGWSAAAEKAIQDCVDQETRQSQGTACTATDVLRCTSIAMLQNCPDDAWKCDEKPRGNR